MAEAALEAGANLINDIWGVGADDTLARLAASRQLPYAVMHNRQEPVYDDLVREIVADLERALDRASGLGVPFHMLIVDPGIGFGKTAEQNLERAARPRRTARIGPAHPARHESQVDDWQGAGRCAGQ